ncbi:ABC transporter permease [Tellurirhabdus bombi]|uniref:ABC transporter permease n=1 Tax=Tellurirhabdus bombi TaxID=2907205 RepID=UPI001F3552CD|nr:ABC transporter permease [Tellurirhabdus bombi]
MVRNYIRVAFRNLWRNKLYSTLNMGGLALGMAVSMLMLLYVVHEHSYDRFHPQANQTVQLTMQKEYGGMKMSSLQLSFSTADRIRQQVPQVEAMTRLISSDWQGKDVLRADDKQFYVKDLHYAEPSFFDFFAFSMKQGDGRKALAQPGTVILTESLARKFFGQTDPMGKTLVFNKEHKLTVAGVMADLPSNTIFRFPALISANSFSRFAPAWKLESGPTGETFFRLRDQTDYKRTETFINKHIALTEEKNVKATCYLSPLTELHLGNSNADSNSTTYVKTFFWIGLGVLLLALINYMNLTTARSTLRAKEVGMRKVLGGNRVELARQFFLESALVSGLAFGLGIVLTVLLKDTFLRLIDARLDTAFLQSPYFLLTLLGILLASILVSGSYPALLLSQFAPMEVLKGRFSQSGGFNVRRVLVVFQFVVSTTLIFCAIVAQRQIQHMQKKDLGLTVEQVMGISLNSSLSTHYDSFRQEVRRQSGVEEIGTSAMAVYNSGFNIWSVKTPKMKDPTTLMGLNVDSQFVQALQLRWKVAPSRMSVGEVFINATAAKELGIAKNPIGQVLNVGDMHKEVRGVVDDFHLTSVKDQIAPMLLMVGADTSRSFADYNGTLYVRFAKGTDIQRQMKQVEQIFQKYAPDSPFDYYFLDDAFNQLFKTEQQLSHVLNLFTGTAIFIACLGLFGLAAFSAERRTKEIGIRKVLGASVSSIVRMLSKEFVGLVIVALVIASPIAWYLMNQWLSDFAYKIEINGWIFALVSLLAVGIALLTVSFQSIKAALTDPVKSLRTE